MTDSEVDQVRAILRAAGVSAAEIDAAPGLVELYRLSGDVGNRPDGAPMSMRALADTTGIPLGSAQRMLRAGGLVADDPDAEVWYSSDLEWIGMTVAAEELFGKEAVEMLVRRAGAAMSQLANAASSAFRATQWDPGREPTPVEIVERNLNTRPLIDLYMRLCGQLYRYHSRLSFRDDSVAAGRFAELRAMGIGFVDLASSTEIGARLSAHELSRWINDFTVVAYDTATSHGARVVKTIGDEVMLCAVEPTAVVAAALELVDYCASHPKFATARGGVAAGEVLEQDGDCFGPVVNRAARFVESAPDGSVMVDSAVATATDARFMVVPATATDHRGIGAVDWFAIARVDRV